MIISNFEKRSFDATPTGNIFISSSGRMSIWASLSIVEYINSINWFVGTWFSLVAISCLDDEWLPVVRAGVDAAISRSIGGDSSENSFFFILETKGFCNGPDVKVGFEECEHFT